jgi:hypothetical protein
MVRAVLKRRNFMAGPACGQRFSRSRQCDGSVVEGDRRDTRGSVNVQTPRWPSLNPITPKAFRDKIGQMIDVVQQI